MNSRDVLKKKKFLKFYDRTQKIKSAWYMIPYSLFMTTPPILLFSIGLWEYLTAKPTYVTIVVNLIMMAVGIFFFLLGLVFSIYVWYFRFKCKTIRKKLHIYNYWQKSFFDLYYYDYDLLFEYEIQKAKENKDKSFEIYKE
ncbi:hypothetical protein V2E24_03195 [Mycoplasmopsis ciconiae]|uniref:Conjugal transfer protein n=1 Tax=Mycoplasmopsis ciconiae TaxID=561067 RepID=A0ABU7MMR0_9BACT|nr:hypothetical protein [Mycoplasmopsis ciconiae]